MKTYPWFRMYHEFATDQTVQVLAFEDQRHFLMALCMKCSGLLDRQFPDSAARLRVLCKTLGLDPVAASEANRRLREIGLVDEDWQPLNWDKRQFASDHDGAARQRRSRDNRKTVTVTTMSRDSNGLDTETESEGESDPEKDRTPLPPKGAEHVFGLNIPVWERWEKYRRELRKPIKPGEQMQAAQKKLAGFGEQQAAVVQQSIENGWTGLFPIRRDTNPPGGKRGPSSPDFPS